MLRIKANWLHCFEENARCRKNFTLPLYFCIHTDTATEHNT